MNGSPLTVDPVVAGVALGLLALSVGCSLASLVLVVRALRAARAAAGGTTGEAGEWSVLWPPREKRTVPVVPVAFTRPGARVGARTALKRAEIRAARRARASRGEV